MNESDLLNDIYRTTATSFSMTKEEWAEYFRWEDEMKKIHGSAFTCGERCFGRDPFKKE